MRALFTKLCIDVKLLICLRGLLLQLCMKVVFFILSDSDPGGLERGSVQRYGSYLAAGRSLLCGPHDLWKLRPLQPAGGHLG